MFSLLCRTARGITITAQQQIHSAILMRKGIPIAGMPLLVYFYLLLNHISLPCSRRSVIEGRSQISEGPKYWIGPGYW